MEVILVKPSRDFTVTSSHALLPSAFTPDDLPGSHAERLAKLPKRE
jgi:hypothetical protein